MKITIEGKPNEIAALVIAIQEQQEEKSKDFEVAPGIMKSQAQASGIGKTIG